MKAVCPGPRPLERASVARQAGGASRYPKPNPKPAQPASIARLRNLEPRIKRGLGVRVLTDYFAGTCAADRRNSIQLSATDVLAPTSMKNAAKCDT